MTGLTCIGHSMSTRGRPQRTSASISAPQLSASPIRSTDNGDGIFFEPIKYSKVDMRFWMTRDILIVDTHSRLCKVYVSAPHAVVHASTNIVVVIFCVLFSFDENYNDGAIRYYVLYISVVDLVHYLTRQERRDFLYMMAMFNSSLRIYCISTYQAVSYLNISMQFSIFISQGQA